MSDSLRIRQQKRNRQEISKDCPSLPKDVLWKIAQFSKSHLRLRLISRDWNQGVIDAHCDSKSPCKKCCCTCSLRQFDLKRLLLPWISKWNFKIQSTTSQELLSEMMYQQQYPGGPQVSRVPSSGRPIPPIKTCSIEIGQANFSDAKPVLLLSQMQHLEELVIRIPKTPALSAEGRKQFIASLAKLQQLKSLEIVDLKFDYEGSVGQQDFHRLIKSNPNLKECVIKGCALTDEALSVFSSTPSISSLDVLKIMHNPTISSEGIQGHIAASPFLSNLKILNLYGSRAQDAAIIAICQSAFLTKLKL